MRDADSRVPNASFGTYSAGTTSITSSMSNRPAQWVCTGQDTGTLTRMARLATHGVDPCYVALNLFEDLLAIANHGSGCIALFRLDPANDLPVEPPSLHTNEGSGPIADRQDRSHAHCACFDRDDRRLSC